MHNPDNMINDANELQLAYPVIEKELSFSCDNFTEEGWMKAFTERINDLIVHDFNKLISILYRLDVSESRLRKFLKTPSQHHSTGTAEVICKLIIERQIEKIKSRRLYRSDENIDENEKW